MKKIHRWLLAAALAGHGPALALVLMEAEGVHVPEHVRVPALIVSGVGLAVVALGGLGFTGEHLARFWRRAPWVLRVNFGLVLVLICSLIGIHRAAKVAGVPVVVALAPSWIGSNPHLVLYGAALPLLFEVALVSALVVVGDRHHMEEEQATVEELQIELSKAEARAGQAEEALARAEELAGTVEYLKVSLSAAEADLEDAQGEIRELKEAAGRVPAVLDGRITELLEASGPLPAGDLARSLSVTPDTIRAAVVRLGLEKVEWDGPGRSKWAFQLPAAAPEVDLELVLPGDGEGVAA